MCGIAGFCNFKEDFEENTDYWNFRLEKMRAVLAHRGNDARGRYLKKHIGLSHSRLAIRDILCGDQPMTRTHNGYEYTICYNGEIYNTDELIPELSENGFVCSTTSDTEVILYAYIHWGAAFVNRLNGIFAFALMFSEFEKFTFSVYVPNLRFSDGIATVCKPPEFAPSSSGFCKL